MFSGGLTAAAGLGWLAQLPLHPAYATHILAPTLVVGTGTSVMMMPAIVAATTGIDPHNAGVASGLINMCCQIGGALGLAALVTIAATVTHHSHSPGPAPVVQGYHTALIIAAAVSIVTALISLLLHGAPDTAPGALATQDAAPANAS